MSLFFNNDFLLTDRVGCTGKISLESLLVNE